MPRRSETSTSARVPLALQIVAVLAAFRLDEGESRLVEQLFLRWRAAELSAAREERCDELRRAGGDEQRRAERVGLGEVKPDVDLVARECLHRVVVDALDLFDERSPARARRLLLSRVAMTMLTLRMISSRRRTLPGDFGVFDLVDGGEVLADLFADFDSDRQQKVRLARRAYSIPSRMYCCVFAPKPVSVATRPARAAASSSSRLPMPSFSCRMPIFFRPSFGTRSSSKMPGGYCLRSSSRYFDVPVRTSSSMMAAVALPMPGVFDAARRLAIEVGRLGVERSIAARGALEAARLKRFGSLSSR